MVNVKISSLNGKGWRVEVIGKLSVTSAFFFPINLIDPRLVALSAKLFAVVNAAFISGGGSVVAVVETASRHPPSRSRCLILSRAEEVTARSEPQGGLADPDSAIVSRCAEA